MAPSAIAAQTPQVSVMSTGTRVDRFTSREGSRNVSPIPLDELDSQSESGWSMVSELSDASKPVYSDAELKAFIAGDAFKHLTLNRQPTGSQPLPGNRVEVDPFNRTGSRCSNSTHVSVEDKPQAHSSRAASRDGLAGDSFFDLDESKFSKMSVLGQAEVEFNGLSHQGSRLFNEPSGLSINSIRELSSTVSPANTTDSRYGQIIKQTVTDRMFKLDSSDSPKESCPPTDTHASGDEASHHCSADSTLLQQATSAQPLREEGGDSTLLQQSTSAHHLREGGGDSTLWQQSTSAQPLREEGGDSTLLQQATSTHHWREEGGDSTLLQQATSDQLLREEGGHVTSSPPSQSNRSWHSSAGRSDTTALPTDSTHTSRDTSAFKSFAKVADSSANTSHSSTLKNNSFAVEPSLHQSLPSKALAVSTANESIEQASLSSLGPVTPGHPICESSHIQRAGAVTPSDRSTHYLSMAEKSKPAASLLGSQRETSGPAKAVKEGVEDNAKQVNDWLRSHGDGYVTESDPVTMHLSNDSTAHPHVSRTNSVYEESLCKVSPVKSDLTSSPTPINAATDNANSTIMQTMLYQNEESTMPGFDSTLCQTRASPNSSRLPLEKLIEVESMLLVPGVHCTLTNTNIDLPVTNLTDRWLQVTAALWEHRINGRISAAEVLHFKQVDTRLKPAMKDVIPIWINAGVAGSHELLIRLLVIGEESQPVNMRVGIEVEKPIVELLDNRDGILDFGVVPYSCTKRVPLTLCNKSRVSTSLVIKVVKDDITRGEMNVEAGGPGLATPPVQDSTRLKVSLSSYEHLGKSHTQTLFVNFKSPVSHGKDGSPETVRGRIAVYQATAASNKPLLYVDTRCTCGHASVQVLAKYHNFEMRCGPQADTVERVALRNSGDVPIDVSISPSDTQHFSVSPDLLSLQPSQQGSYLLTFRTHNISDYLNSVHCKLTATIEPNGKKCAIDVKGTVDPPSAIPARLSSLVNSSQAGPLPAAGTKMKIKCAPQVLKFAGVAVDERKYITLKVLNHYEKSMKLNLDIDKSEFQICTLIDGVEQLRSSRELILPVSSSEKDTFHIRVCFEPRRVGFVKARLKVQSPDKTITFRVSIYGYGGQSVVEPALECSPSSGVYNLSAGDVHHKHLFTHQFYLRNVGHQKAFVLMQCFSGAECTKRLELSRIQMVPASLVVSPADARKVTMNVRITEREKVLCERSKDVIASVKVTYVDQVLRTILQRLTAVHPQLRDNQIEPFLSTIPDDQKSDTIINMPDEAVNVNVFKQSLRSFVINVYADPKKPPAAVQRPLDVLQPNTSPQGLVVSTRSLTFSTSRPKETQELLVHLRNRSSLDIPMTFSSLGSPFKCKSKSSTLRAKNKGSLKLLFTAECLGTWNETFTITSPDKSVHIDLIGKCGASW